MPIPATLTDTDINSHHDVVRAVLDDLDQRLDTYAAQIGRNVIIASLNRTPMPDDHWDLTEAAEALILKMEAIKRGHDDIIDTLES